MAWSNLSSNQFVSYTDAQTSGISTKTTLPTSNQWMTKDNVTTYLNVNTSYLTSYTSNQFVPKPKPKEVKGVWPFEVKSVLISYSKLCIAS